MSERLLLENVRNVLVRLEETIIFGLIERAQFRRNRRIYRPGVFGSALEGLSLMAYCLRETERVHARMRRFTSPDEHPFFTDLPAPVLPTLAFDHNPLRPNRINLNKRILTLYVGRIVPLICEPGDDRQYGSSSVCDVTCLAALSRRIHYGKFVAESKRRARPAAFAEPIRARDRSALLDLIADTRVETAVLHRVGKKARAHGRELRDAGDMHVPDPERVVDIYRQWIIPLNKEVQVEYLLSRHDAPPSGQAHKARPVPVQ